MSPRARRDLPEDRKVEIELVQGYRFRVSFPDEDRTTLFMDEPSPLGGSKGPNASKVLAASIANCLCASLLFCLQKARIELDGIRAEAEPILSRNKYGYWRVTKVSVNIFPSFKSDESRQRAKRCLEIFENYCVVTSAVRSGITVDVAVEGKNIPK